MDQKEKTLSLFSVSDLFKSVLYDQDADDIALEGRDYYLAKRVWRLLGAVIGAKENNFDEVELYKEIEKIIDKDEVLFGYIFFLNSNERFNYTGNYLREQVVRFKNFIYKACRFIRQLVNDVNLTKEVLAPNSDVVVIFQNLVRVRFSKNMQQGEPVIEWKSFGQFINVVEEYLITIEYMDTDFLTFKRQYSTVSDKKFQHFLEEVKKGLSNIGI